MDVPLAFARGGLFRVPPTYAAPFFHCVPEQLVNSLPLQSLTQESILPITQISFLRLHNQKYFYIIDL